MSRAAYAIAVAALGRAHGRREDDRHDGRRAHRSVRHGPHGHHRGERRGASARFTREQQDEFAVESHRRARSGASTAGHFKDQILPIELKSKKGAGRCSTPTSTCARTRRSKAWRKLKAVFKKENGTVTAGNASGINDGAAAVVLMEKSAAAEEAA